MKYLLLDSLISKLSVDSGCLEVYQKENKLFNTEKINKKYYPQLNEIDRIIITGRCSFTTDVIKWCNRENVAIVLLDWRGRLISVIYEPNHSITTRLNQYKIYSDTKKGNYVSKAIIDGKVLNQIRMLEYLKSNYGNDEVIEKSLSFINSYRNDSYCSLKNLESNCAKSYWLAIQQILPEKWKFIGRGHGTRKRSLKAINKVNAFLNYSYSIIESECYKAIQKVGLDDKIGFIHKPANYKSPLVYDMQELFRWIAEKIVITNIFEKNVFYNDFVRMNNGIYRVKDKGIKKLLHWFESEFDNKVKYKNKNYSWLTMFYIHSLQIKNYINSKVRSLDFSKPIPTF